MNKLPSVLLIDDDEPTNFLNVKILKKAGFTKQQIIIKETGKAALEYLRLQDSSGAGFPELIFLDINMPAMNGWEFLDKYSSTTADEPNERVIIMLTTSLNPEDELRSEEYALVNGYQTKPLTIEVLDNIKSRFF